MQENLTELQRIKAELVILAEYLQTSLSDPQIKLYAAELQDIGSVGLMRAIAALKADPSVWSGRFPLPAKLRSYAHGDIDRQASEYLDLIMRCGTHQELYSLPGPALAAAKAYGFTAIVERNAMSTPTIYAQLRESLRNKLYGLAIERKPLGLPNAHQGTREENALPAPDASGVGEDLLESLVPRRSADESEG